MVLMPCAGKKGKGPTTSEYSSKNDGIIKKRVDGRNGQFRMYLQQHEFSWICRVKLPFLGPYLFL